MVINHSLRFDLSSILPPNNGASLSPNLLQYNCPFSSNSKFHNSPAFTTQIHSTSNEDAPRSRSGGSSGLSSTALEKEANSNHGRKWGGRRGGRERGINKSGHIMYKGVRKCKGGRWVAEIHELGKKSCIWLGTFSIAEMVASAYDVAAFNLKMVCTYLNFPQHVSMFPILSSHSPKCIQEAASVFASSTPLATTTHIRKAGGLVATPTPHVHHTSTSLAMEKRAFAFEEDMMFDMPNVLGDMAHALMIPPPLHYLATPANAHNNNTFGWDCDEQFSLWNF